MWSIIKCIRVFKNRDPSKLLNQSLNHYSTEFVISRSIWNKCTVLLQANSQNIRSSQFRAASFPKYFSVKAAQSNEDDNYRSENNITVVGDDIPSPYTDVEQCDFPDYIKDFLKKQGFTKPTVIQSQGWPIALKGKNLVGIAQTGTGKTLAYLLPAVVHIKETKARKGKGPRVLVLAPTRELARQIEAVAKDFEKLLYIRCACIYGGASKYVQGQMLQDGVDIVIATPGRLNDFLMSKVTSLHRCTYVVLDEADRMLDMGFEPQIRQALEGVPAERQILMFSATWPKEVQHLAKDYLGEFVQVNVGSTELSANHNIKQHVHICDRDNKMLLFKKIMKEISTSPDCGKILVFTNTKRFVDSLAHILRGSNFQALGIHGDKTQAQRDSIIGRFKSGSAKILVATDVAARGLDVDGVSHVINFDFPSNPEDYIHRIGRTGRQDNRGESHSFLTSEDDRCAKDLIAILKEANQEVPQELLEMAENYDITKSMERKSKYQAKRNSFNPNYNNRWHRNRSSDNEYSFDRQERNERYGSNQRYGNNNRYNNERYGRNDRYNNDRQRRNDRFDDDDGYDRSQKYDRDSKNDNFDRYSKSDY